MSAVFPNFEKFLFNYTGYMLTSQISIGSVPATLNHSYPSCERSVANHGRGGRAAVGNAGSERSNDLQGMFGERHDIRFELRRAAFALAAALLASVAAPPLAHAETAACVVGTGRDSGRPLSHRQGRWRRRLLSRGGPADAPTVLLLHGFPTSSHMFRNLIPALADRYHVIAPDYPGFGESAAPDHKTVRLHVRPLCRHRRWPADAARRRRTMRSTSWITARPSATGWRSSTPSA